MQTSNQPLTALDRCDACGAQAYMRVRVATGELLFCVHHARKHAPVLKEVSVVVQDETEKLFGDQASVELV